MEKRNYKTPEIEIIKVETEGAIMALSFTDPGQTQSTTVTIKQVSNSTYSMDDYNWK